MLCAGTPPRNPGEEGVDHHTAPGVPAPQFASGGPPAVPPREHGAGVVRVEPHVPERVVVQAL